MSLRERVRWNVARLADLSPRTCWAELVEWACLGDLSDYGPTLLDILKRDGRTGRCKPDCYCGKNMTPESRAKMEAQSANRPTELPF